MTKNNIFAFSFMSKQQHLDEGTRLSLTYHQLLQKTQLLSLSQSDKLYIFFYLEAEQPYTVDDVVLSFGSRGWQY